MTHKTLISLLLGSSLGLFLGACSPQSGAPNPEIPNTEIVGSDRDAHGCIGSAGYTWSDAKQDCLRVWEDGLALEDKTGEAGSANAYLVSGANSKTQELFLPQDGSVILKPTQGGKWQQWQDAAEVYTLVEDVANGFVVYSEDGDVLYAQAPETNDLADDEIRQIGIVKSVEDSGYPMFTLSLEIPKHEKIYVLTVNAETLNGGVDLMNGLIGKYATVYYTSDVEKMVMGIHNENGSIYTEPETFDISQSTSISGVLGGATSPSGDLPTPFTITNTDGDETKFLEFITDELIAQNGKTVTVYYYERYTNQITRIEALED